MFNIRHAFCTYGFLRFWKHDRFQLFICHIGIKRPADFQFPGTLLDLDDSFLGYTAGVDDLVWRDHLIKRREYMTMVQTVIGINSAMMRRPDKKRKKMDYKKELQEIIDQVESAKNRLAEVTEAMDLDDREVDSLDEALDAWTR